MNIIRNNVNTLAECSKKFRKFIPSHRAQISFRITTNPWDDLFANRRTTNVCGPKTRTSSVYITWWFGWSGGVSRVCNDSKATPRLNFLLLTGIRWDCGNDAVQSSYVCLRPSELRGALPNRPWKPWAIATRSFQKLPSAVRSRITPETSRSAPLPQLPLTASTTRFTRSSRKWCTMARNSAFTTFSRDRSRSQGVSYTEVHLTLLYPPYLRNEFVV